MIIIKYNSVPDIITGKDLDYLSDAFKWNMTLYKLLLLFNSKVKNNAIKNQLEKINKLTKDNMNNIITVLKEHANEN